MKLNPNHYKIGRDGSALQAVKDYQPNHSLSKSSLKDQKVPQDHEEDQDKSRKEMKKKGSVNGTNVHDLAVAQFNPGSAVYYDIKSDIKLSKLLRKSQDKTLNASFGPED